VLDVHQAIHRAIALRERTRHARGQIARADLGDRLGRQVGVELFLLLFVVDVRAHLQGQLAKLSEDLDLLFLIRGQKIVHGADGAERVRMDRAVSLELSADLGDVVGCLREDGERAADARLFDRLDETSVVQSTRLCLERTACKLRKSYSSGSCRAACTSATPDTTESARQPASTARGEASAKRAKRTP
jgi:hypothetical protein